MSFLYVASVASGCFKDKFGYYICVYDIGSTLGMGCGRDGHRGEQDATGEDGGTAETAVMNDARALFHYAGTDALA
jgi:hypothetical protein